jgi:hypothetical protein
MLVVRVTEIVRAVQSSYYSSCPWVGIRLNQGCQRQIEAPFSPHFWGLLVIKPQDGSE